jgi:uncharacterized protein YkwD
MARSARRVLATSIVLGAICCAATTASHSFAAGSAATPLTASATVSTVLELTNAERTRAGLSPLHENSGLMYAAQLQSEQMESASRLDHVLRGAPYPNPPDRLAAANYAWEAYGENVAMGQRSGAEVVSAWMNSPRHRANILNPRYTELGIGYALDRAGRPYYAQVFGRPSSQRSSRATR